MNQEIGKGTNLGITLVAITAFLALTCGLFAIAKADGQLTPDVIESLTRASTVLAINSVVAGVCLKAILAISSNKANYGAFETYGKVSKLESLLVTGGINEAKAVKNANKAYKSYDTIQYRRYMRKISLIQAILCKPDKITEHTAIVADRTERKHIAGTVESIGAYYKVGDTYLIRSLTSLVPGKEVALDIEYPISYASAINIHNDYKVV